MHKPHAKREIRRDPKRLRLGVVIYISTTYCIFAPSTPFPGSAEPTGSNWAHAHAADICNFSATKRAWRATKPRCFIIISDSTYLRSNVSLRIVRFSDVFVGGKIPFLFALKVRLFHRLSDTRYTSVTRFLYGLFPPSQK